MKLEGAIQSEFGVAKRVILATLGDIVIHLGRPPEVDLEELIVPQYEYWYSATKIPRYAAGSENFDEVTT